MNRSNAMAVEIDDLLEQAIESGQLELPLLPRVAGQVLSATFSGECDPRELAQTVQHDQSLAGHVLRLANSPLYAPRVPIVSLQQAIHRLGIAKIRQIALIVACESRVFQVEGFEETVRFLYQHSLTAGTLAQEIARLRRWNVEEAFLGGLLHDVGRPVLLQHLVDLARTRSLTLDGTTVSQALDRHHARVGADLVKRWGLSDSLSEIILYHHRPEAAPTVSRNAMVVSFADVLSLHCLCGEDTGDELLFTHPWAQKLNLYPDDVGTLLARKAQILEIARTMA